MRLMAAAVVLLAFISSVEARPRHRAQRVSVIEQIVVCDMQGCRADRASGAHPTIRAAVAYEGEIVGSRPAGCPRAYCGCGVSLKVFGRIIPELNLAVNWLHKFPRTQPAAGMVAARSGHVFLIVSVIDTSTVVAYDPNSGGHRTRIHTVSLRGFRVVDPHGSRLASN